MLAFRTLLPAIAFAAAAAISSTAQATTTTYSNLGDFTAASGSVGVGTASVDCGSPALRCFVPLNPAEYAGVIKFSTDAGSNVNVTSYNWYSPTFYVNDFFTEGFNPTQPNTLTIALEIDTSQVQGIGLDIGTYTGNYSISYLLSNGYTDSAPGANFGSTSWRCYT